MVETRKEDFERIWSYVSQRINREDTEWLMEKRPGTIYEGSNFPKNSTEALRMLVAPNAHWRFLSNNEMQNISFTIQDVLDAKRKKDTMGYNGGNDLPKKYWIQLAKMLGLKVSENISGTELSRLVLEKI